MRNYCSRFSILLVTLTKLECVFASGINEKTSMFLFPWLCQIIGVVVYFVLSRRCHWFPYTASLFLIGVIMGLSSRDSAADGSYRSLLEASIEQWMLIDGDLLLLIFLPGLLFLDAFNVKCHLFFKSIFQLILLAFPGVLAGTLLTGMVAKEFMDWKFNLAMTFGSILAATDPVAVCALLNECGAPPRLKMHVSGESLLNDGAAIVFFTIFRKLYYNDINEEGGEDINVAKGFNLFFKMSLGGAALGIAFGLGLIYLLVNLKRRLESEENIVQVAATMTVAYISFYVSEAIFHMSGVITVVICGITLRGFGEGIINDSALMQNFWSLVEHLLNTVLFTLAGTLWGDAVRKRSTNFFSDLYKFIVLYVVVVVIRFSLIFGLFPINSRIGLKSNWKEAFFLSWGGLRGAVGIALAINLMRQVENGDNQKDVQDLFVIVGGITVLTLVINGPTSAPVLRKLRLGFPTNSRKKLIHVAEESIKRRVLDDFVHLLTYKVFSTITFPDVQKRVPMLADLTVSELKEAVVENKKNVPDTVYKRPNVRAILPYLMNTTEDEEQVADTDFLNWRQEEEMSKSLDNDADDFACVSKKALGLRTASILKTSPNMDVVEHRLIFLDLLRSGYHNQIERGHLDPRFGELSVYLLFTSLEFAGEEIRLGKPLDDWESMKQLKNSLLVNGWKFSLLGYKEILKKNPFHLFCSSGGEKKDDSDHFKSQQDILTIIGFLQAHTYAEEKFEEFFYDCGNDLNVSKNKILEESKLCVTKAQETLRSFKKNKINQVATIHFCAILLNKYARYVMVLKDTGVLSEKEARHMTEHIQELLISNRSFIPSSGELNCLQISGEGGRFSNDFSSINIFKPQVSEDKSSSDS